MARMNARGARRIARAEKIVTPPDGERSYRQVLALRSDGAVLQRIDHLNYQGTGYTCGHWSLFGTSRSHTLEGFHALAAANHYAVTP